MRKHVMLLLFLSSFSLSAQTIDVGVFTGGAFYSGDLNENKLDNYLQFLHSANGAFVRWNHGLVSMKLGFNMAKLSGDDQFGPYPERQLHFRTDLKELALTTQLNLIRWETSNYAAITPYLFGGVAVFRFNPEAQYDNKWIELQPIGTEGQGLPGYDEPYNLTQFAIPMGLGIKFEMSDRIALSFEFGARKLFTDYLDDIGGTSISYIELSRGSGPEVARISFPSVDPDKANEMGVLPRGNSSHKDWYYISGISITYSFDWTKSAIYTNSGKRFGCPTFKI